MNIDDKIKYVIMEYVDPDGLLTKTELDELIDEVYSDARYNKDLPDSDVGKIAGEILNTE